MGKVHATVGIGGTSASGKAYALEWLAFSDSGYLIDQVTALTSHLRVATVNQDTGRLEFWGCEGDLVMAVELPDAVRRALGA